MKQTIRAGIAGFSAGVLNGLFGAGGGMVLIPLLNKLTDIEENNLFSTSVAILLPICIVSLCFSEGWEMFVLSSALPYLFGSAIGGVLAGTVGQKIPSLLLHRVLGALILWGGIRYIW